MFIDNDKCSNHHYHNMIYVLSRVNIKVKKGNHHDHPFLLYIKLRPNERA
jgi:hypothetical protein